MNELMDCKQFVEVKCDWQSNVDGMDIEDCVVAQFLQPENETPLLDTLDLIENSKCSCVNFTKPENKNDIFLYIKCDSRYLISKIILCCEAKIIEVFGKTGEYVTTLVSVPSEDGEYSMNSHLICINSTKCSLKLEQLKNPDFVWIYGILIYLTETKEQSNQSIGPINMNNVQNLLNPDLLTTNASKLFSTLNLKESKSNSNDFFNSIINKFENTKTLDGDISSQLLMNFQQFEKRVEDKLNDMAHQMNTIGNDIQILNTKFDVILNLLNGKNIL